VKFRISLSNQAEKFLDKMDDRFVERVNTRFIKLSENPFRHLELDIKKMRGSANDYRLRIGKYRFVYTVFKEEKLIYIYKADKRGDIY